jgi:hypothetical protein
MLSTAAIGHSSNERAHICNLKLSDEFALKNMKLALWVEYELLMENMHKEQRGSLWLLERKQN